MRLSDASSYALGHLKRHPLRTGLTACGVAVGIGTLTLLVSLGQGLQDLVEGQINSADLVTKIHVMPKGGRDQVMRGAVPSGGGESTPITNETLEQLSAIKGVVVAYPLVQAAVVAEHDGVITFLPLDGLPFAALGATHQEALIAGRYWKKEETGLVCVLPSTVIEELGFESAEKAIGAEILLSGPESLRRYKRVQVEGPKGEPGVRFERPEGLETTPMQVVGVFRSKDFGQFGSFVQCPLPVATELAKKLNPFRRTSDDMHQLAIVKVASADDIDRVSAEVQKLGYETITVFDLLKQIRIVFLVFKVLLGMFGGIGLIVSLFGIANTMVMAVLERTREIGVLKALGARHRDVRRTFLAEAGAIGAIGGAMGIAGAWAFGQLLNLIANRLLAEQLDPGTWLAFFHVSFPLGSGILCMSIFVAAAAGLWPAVRASRLDPVVALRLE